MSIVRTLRLAALPALLVALGCASSHPRALPGPAPFETAPFEARAVDAERHPTTVVLTPVYFATDRAELKADARGALARHARSILEHPEWGVVTIEGHCDERGSAEYNLALGLRRATAVQRYLTRRGVPAARLAVQSYGEERPAVPGHEPYVWRYNRRSELRIAPLHAASR